MRLYLALLALLAVAGLVVADEWSGGFAVCHALNSTNIRNMVLRCCVCAVKTENKRQTLILPTELRINFWLLYCKSKYEKSKLAGLADAHKALYHYDANIKNYLKNNK